MFLLSDNNFAAACVPGGEVCFVQNYVLGPGNEH